MNHGFRNVGILMSRGGSVKQKVAALSLSIISPAVGDFAGLVSALRHDNGFVRMAAIYALGQLGDERAIPLLRLLLDDYTYPTARDAAGRVNQSIYRATRPRALWR
jgi:HEAT repeat protein